MDARRSGRWLWFSGWALIGCTTAFAGLVFIPLAALIVLVAVPALVWHGDLHRPALGVVSGMGIMLLVVAFILRSAGPVPWLLAGLVLLTAGLAAFALPARGGQNSGHG